MEYSVEDLLLLFLKRFYVIVIFTGLCLFITYFITSNVLEPKYKAESKIYATVDFGEKMTATEALNYGQKMTNTYATFLTTNQFLEVLLENEGLDYSLTKLKKNIEITNIYDTCILNIEVTDSDAQKAIKIANGISQLAPIEIKNVQENAVVKIIDPASKSEKVGPNMIKNLLIGGILGIMFSMSFILAIDFFDGKIKNSEIVKRKFDIPVIGNIPTLNK